jgi:anti-sigma regulatory factor (Ser/Thr protein kinase)
MAQGQATFQLPGGAQAPARARQIVGVTIGVVLPEKQAYQASLLTSEIVSNSVLHGRAGQEDQIELAMSWNTDHVRLEVTDEGPGFQIPHHDPDRQGGWGLALVESMSDRWGIERGDRTRVWFELGTAEAA